MNSVLTSMGVSGGTLSLEGPRGASAAVTPAMVLAALAAQGPATPSVQRDGAIASLLASVASAMGGCFDPTEWTLVIPDWTTGEISEFKVGP